MHIDGDGRDNASELWRHYLDLDTPYDAIREQVISLEPRLCDAAKQRGGMHILNQPAWEALCSFILSQNNNIPRIRGLVEKLCALCGNQLADGGYDFPDAPTVAALSEDDLRSIGCGYRAAYVLSAAREVAGGALDLEALRVMPLEEARQRLVAMHGIGDKVADCVLLYGLHRLECFPRDVWIKRALAGPFRDTPLLDSPYAGIAQQYIFEYIRQQ
ncbi:MAG: DNA-3-methyladenine glycosylase 2 family protein [Clostridia bacterium]|nr:DNA-3-methyladenine glycosylase 2 family protein [Clostridia bacterium]